VLVSEEHAQLELTRLREQAFEALVKIFRRLVDDEICGLAFAVGTATRSKAAAMTCAIMYRPKSADASVLRSAFDVFTKTTF